MRAGPTIAVPPSGPTRIQRATSRSSTDQVADAAAQVAELDDCAGTRSSVVPRYRPATGATVLARERTRRTGVAAAALDADTAAGRLVKPSTSILLFAASIADLIPLNGPVSEGSRARSARVPRRQMRFYEFESRRIVERAGIPVTEVRLLHDRRRGPRGRRADRRPDRDQVAGPDRRADEGRRRQVRRHARGGRRARGRDPRARDRRPHAGRRPRRPQGRGRAGVLRRRALGRARQAADDALQRHGRHRHRAGRRGAPRPRRPRPPLQPAPDRRLPRPSRPSPTAA